MTMKTRSHNKSTPQFEKLQNGAKTNLISISEVIIS